MKLNIFLVLLVVACAFAESKQKEEDPWSNLQQEWKAVYGKYGYDAYYPLQYRLTRYSYPTYPTYQVQPSYSVVQPSYPIINTYPTYSKPIVTYPVRVKASYDPEYFSQRYGYYPAY